MKKILSVFLAFVFASSVFAEASPEDLEDLEKEASTRFWRYTLFYLGLIEKTRSTGDFLAMSHVIHNGESSGWTVKDDNFAVASAWLRLYIMQKDPNIKPDVQNTRALEPIKKKIDAYVKKIETAKQNGNMNAGMELRPKTKDECGEFFAFAMPLSFLYKATGDKKYLDALSDSYRFLKPDDVDSYTFVALAYMLVNLPASDPTCQFFQSVFTKAADRILSGGKYGGLEAFAFAFAVNKGILPRDKYLLAAKEAMGKQPNFKNLNYTLEVEGITLLLASEIAKVDGLEIKKSDRLFYLAAESINKQAKPKAYAHIEPRRADDLAFENSKMAFRIYGPALYSGVENSGIDAWVKSVEYPVIDKWYELDLLKISPYHDNIGEGLDTFNVGDTVGCGGDVIIKNGKIFRGNVYRSCDVFLSLGDEAIFVAYYLYENVEGEKISQKRTFRLKKDADFCELESEYRLGDFIEKGFENLKPASGIEVAAGLRTQSAKPEIVCDENAKSIKTKDAFAGKTLTMNLEISPETKFLRFMKNGAENLAVLETNAEGKTKHKFGFTWK